VKKGYLVPVGIALLLLLTRTWLSTAGSTPGGQPSLVGLDASLSLKAQFNGDASRMRGVFLLSASCPYCLKGASKIQRILERHSQHPITAYVVWQPILPTDWGLPGTGALHRLSDARVRQFWDADHHVARALEQSSRGRERQPGCCFQKEIWWDMMAVYPPGALWSDTLPEPLLLDGTVEEAAPAFEALLKPPS
jgi:hypothetical protein